MNRYQRISINIFLIPFTLIIIGLVAQAAYTQPKESDKVYEVYQVMEYSNGEFSNQHYVFIFYRFTQTSVIKIQGKQIEVYNIKNVENTDGKIVNKLYHLYNPDIRSIGIGKEYIVEIIGDKLLLYSRVSAL